MVFSDPFRAQISTLGGNHVIDKGGDHLFPPLPPLEEPREGATLAMITTEIDRAKWPVDSQAAEKWLTHLEASLRISRSYRACVMRPSRRRFCHHSNSSMTLQSYHTSLFESTCVIMRGRVRRHLPRAEGSLPGWLRDTILRPSRWAPVPPM